MENTELDIVEKQFNDYAFECACALRSLESQIGNIEASMERNLERNLIDSVSSRVKTFPSTVEKYNRKKYGEKYGGKITIDGIKENVYDVAGIRIITLFRDDIYAVAEQISQQYGIEVVEVKDYIKEPKANGYRSLHITVKVATWVDGKTKFLPVEIQIRSAAMNMWSSIEHNVKYKKLICSPDAESQFKAMADHLAKFEELAIKLRDFKEKPVPKKTIKKPENPTNKKPSV